MNRSVYLILSAAMVLLFLGFLYDNFSQVKADAQPVKKEREVKNGPVRTMDERGNLKTVINYRNGVKHGLSYLYYPDGKTVQLELPYENGKRQGTSKKYFKTGKLYAETSYKNNEIHGIRKIYYRDGDEKLKAEVPYGFGYPGTGLKEYLLDGSEKAMPEITWTQKSGLLYLSTSLPCRNTKFYLGSLIENRFLDTIDDDIQMLPENDNEYYIDLKMFTPSFLEYQDVICACESTMGNKIILRKRIDTSSLKKVN